MSSNNAYEDEKKKVLNRLTIALKKNDYSELIFECFLPKRV